MYMELKGLQYMMYTADLCVSFDLTFALLL